MSVFPTNGIRRDEEPVPVKLTVPQLQAKKQTRQKISALTAYDYPSARLVDEAGIDMILVGDSLGMVVMGLDSTLEVTVDEMLHHTRACRRACRRAVLVADMPYGSYHSSVDKAVDNALRFVKEAGAEAVKIEGGRRRLKLVEALVAAEVPVVGHIGLTPQSMHAMGGFKVQGKSLKAARELLEDALLLERAGVSMLVVEGVPRELAERMTAELQIPVIGIGAGPGCDGQILVLHDLLNLSFRPAAKFARQYADVATLVRNAVDAYREDVEQGTFPAEAESYHLNRDVRAEMEKDEFLCRA